MMVHNAKNERECEIRGVRGRREGPNGGDRGVVIVVYVYVSMCVCEFAREERRVKTRERMRGF